MSRLQDDGDVVPRWLYNQACGLLAELVARVQQLQHELACYSVIVEQLASEGAGSTRIGSRVVNDTPGSRDEQDHAAHPQTKYP